MQFCSFIDVQTGAFEKSCAIPCFVPSPSLLQAKIQLVLVHKSWSCLHTKFLLLLLSHTLLVTQQHAWVLPLTGWPTEPFCLLSTSVSVQQKTKVKTLWRLHLLQGQTMEEVQQRSLCRTEPQQMPVLGFLQLPVVTWSDKLWTSFAY